MKKNPFPDDMFSPFSWFVITLMYVHVFIFITSLILISYLLLKTSVYNILIDS